MSRQPGDLTARQAAIEALVQQLGFATIAELASRFNVTTQTIRRDVKALCTEEGLARFHGGIGLSISTQNEAYTERRAIHTAAKEAIGRIVARIIPDRASLFMNIGTTTEAAARHLCARKELRVVTNNLHIAETLSQQEGFEVMVAGGQLRGGDGGIVGEAAIEFLRGFRLDFGVIGISGIDPDGALLDFDYREVRAAQAIIANARRIILVADHTKFGRPAMAKVAQLDAVDILVTDRPVPAEFADIVGRSGVEIMHPGNGGPVPPFCT